jgi:hypothetical protein
MARTMILAKLHPPNSFTMSFYCFLVSLRLLQEEKKFCHRPDFLPCVILHVRVHSLEIRDDDIEFETLACSIKSVQIINLH